MSQLSTLLLYLKNITTMASWLEGVVPISVTVHDLLNACLLFIICFSYSTLSFILTVSLTQHNYALVLTRGNWQRYVSPSLPYHIKHARHYTIDYFVQLLTHIKANNNVRLKHWDGANPSSPKCWTRIVLHPDA